MKLKHQNDASFIYPRLRVFLSVDLIGSTRYKFKVAAENERPGNWQMTLLGFYSDFQSKFFENWVQWEKKHHSNGNGVTLAGVPRLWKTLGDELIFWKECHSAREVCGVVQVWRKTLLDFKASWMHPELQFKSGAWLVGSPFRNWEVAFLREPMSEEDEPYLGNPIAFNFHLLSHYYDETSSRKIDLDFIGPSMDAGFRLLKLVDEERFILSADLASVIATESSGWKHDYKDEQYPPLTFFIDKPEALDGVTRPNVDYPVVWLSAFEGAELTHEVNYMTKVRSSRRLEPISIDSGDVQDLLDIYLEKVSGFPEKPYICRPTDHGLEVVFNSLPDGHKNFIEEIRSIYLNAADQDDDIVASLRAKKGRRESSEEIDHILDEILKSLEKAQGNNSDDK